MLEPSVPDPTWLALRLQARAAVLAAIPKDGACVEIGTWKGEFSTEILAVAKPKQLVLVDPWAFREEFPNRWYGGVAGNKSGGDGRDFRIRVRALSELTGGHNLPPAVLHRGRCV